MTSIISLQNIVAALIFISVLAFTFVILTILNKKAGYRGTIQNRLNANHDLQIGTEEELVRIRRSRSLTADGHYLLPLVSINKLILQSGSQIGLAGLLLFILLITVLFFVCCVFANIDSWIALLASPFVGIFLPIMILKTMRERRQRRFEEQLPDAIDTLVRSLRAGHALPVAITSVGQNMPDPIGAEFRLTSAEVTYGLDLETGMINLRSRVGQPDLSLIVLAVSLQARTGGNLAEILTNLSRVIRSRFKLRRRAHALSAEGRFSAILLGFLPVALFGVLRFMSPNYYSDIWPNPNVKLILGGAVLWMLLGGYVMSRMVRIRV